MNKILIFSATVFVIFFALISNCFAAFTYTICDESQLKGTVDWINITDCDPNLTDRCIFKKGTNVTIYSGFTSKESTAGLKVKIYGTVLGFSVPWRVNPDNACVRGVKCPIEINDQNQFMMEMPISPVYPSIPVVVKVRLEDSRKRPHFCVQFPAKIE